MIIEIPLNTYIELAIKNISLMDYTSNPFLDNEFSGYYRSEEKKVIKLDLDRLPYIYVNEVINESKKFFTNEIERLEKELLDAKNEREHNKIENEISKYRHYFVSIELYIAMREGSLKETPKTLRQMYYALKQFLDKELPKSKEGWIYSYDKTNDCFQPYLFTNIMFNEARSKEDRDSIKINYKYINENKEVSSHIYISYTEMKLAKRNPKDLLLSLGYHLEENEWYEQYIKTTEDFYKKSVMQNKEFTDNQGTRYVNDNLFRLNGSEIYKNKSISYFGETEEFRNIPIIPRIYVYNLKAYIHQFLDTRTIKPYVYDERIEDKLILPKEHKNLIDILLSEQYQIKNSDIIEGKGNGTIILAMGSAGLGKTLTSEIYAERKGIPRLLIHASQLGTNENNIESKLNYFMALAERWKCILLIDEADVYIRKRGDDVQHNAIVATMLQRIEYFNGILFMTTNRVDDVDEAIISRCSAVLKYSKPDKDMSRNLWNIFLEQNNLKDKVSDEVLEEILSNFGALAGRDIRNIISLVHRYAIGNNIEKIDFEVFKLCATFRGIYSIGGHEKTNEKENIKNEK